MRTAMLRTLHFAHHLLCASMVVGFASAAADAADWGSMKGRFVFKEAVRPDALKITKDQEYCTKDEHADKLVDESIVVGEENGLQNVFVYVYLRSRDKIEIHPDYEKQEAKPVKLDNIGCRFEPHCLTLWTKHPFEVRNSDPGIGHNTNMKVVTSGNTGFNEIVPNDTPLVKQFKASEPYPSPIACNIHPWMTAHVLIRDNPYMAVSNNKGEFEIKNLPAGEHTFILWHEAKGVMKNLTVGDEKTDRRRGRVELTIPAGETLDLGEIDVPASVIRP